MQNLFHGFCSQKTPKTCSLANIKAIILRCTLITPFDSCQRTMK